MKKNFLKIKKKVNWVDSYAHQEKEFLLKHARSNQNLENLKKLAEMGEIAES